MSKKVEPRILSGFLELLPEEQIVFDWMKQVIEDTYKKHGFVSIDTPVIELSEVLLAKAGGETEKQIYRFNKGDNDLSLRFDLTVPLARYVAKNYPYLVFPFKRYAIGKSYRGERPQKGRFREFYQCDIDIVGNETLDLAYDAQIVLVVSDVFNALGFNDITVKINNRKILNGFFEYIGIEEVKAEVLKLIDKIDKIGFDNFVLSLKDIISDDIIINKILDFLKIDGSNDEIIARLKEYDIDNETYKIGVYELDKVYSDLKLLGVNDDIYKFTLTLARGLDYYTGTVYETVLNEYREIGSVCGGGRYNDLASYYTDKTLPGVGVSIGLTRLYSKLRELDVFKSSVKTYLKAMIIDLNGGYNKCLDLLAKLRKENISVDMPFLNGKGMKQKMQYASRIGVKYTILIGEDEVKNDVYALKNMETGEQITLDYVSLLGKLKDE